MTIDWDKIAQENTAFLSRLLQFDTTNPPGNETECLRWVQAELQQDGIQSQILESAPGRGNLVARLQAGQGATGGPLLLMGHVDVVMAVSKDWKHHPFSGKVVDGCVWGRGALDMKGKVATWVTLFRLLKRLGFPLQRDVVLLLLSDEETGGAYGIEWMVENHWDLIECEAALNEGGGSPITVNDRLYYTYSLDEKRATRFTMRATGRGSHGSIPTDDNAVVHLARAVLALGTSRTPIHVHPSFASCVTALAAGQPEPFRSDFIEALDPVKTDDVFDRLVSDSDVREKLRAAARNTTSPTMLEAGAKINVIPRTAECSVDCRAVPGVEPEAVRAEVEAILRAAGVADKIELEFMVRPAYPASPAEHTVVDSIRKALQVHVPEATLLPMVTTGATDSRHLRAKGVCAYGFSPTLPEVDHSGVHGVNERVSLRQIAWSTRLLGDMLLDYCCQAYEKSSHDKQESPGR